MQSGGLKSFRRLFHKVNLRAKNQNVQPKVREREGEEEVVKERGRAGSTGSRVPADCVGKFTVDANEATTMHTRLHTTCQHCNTPAQSTRGDAHTHAHTQCSCVRVCAAQCEGPIAERENIIYSICDSSSLCPTCLIKIAV